ncbi:hypothetical protein HNP25_000003 [Arcicella rosea]|uniref:Uncharacterized protein n=1 Tax=Arcicella rosea TaxID=502909 RepID=A0A841EGE0_9BACT|nr:hypothetical protein [Arcicella rosea]
MLFPITDFQSNKEHQFNEGLEIRVTVCYNLMIFL